MVRAGYKQTEVGVIPEDWKLAQLGDVANVIMGQSPKGTSYNTDGIGVALINGPTEFTEKYPVKMQWTTEPIRLCKANDLLLCVRGSSTGRMNIADDEYCIGRGVAAIRANTKANTEYLTYQIHLAIEKLLALSAGSTFPSVDGKAIKSIPIPYPDVDEQRAIAAVLSDVDGLIAGLDRLIAKKRDVKTAVMQQLLTGEKRLMGFGNGRGYKQTEIGEIPEDWNTTQLKNVLQKKPQYGINAPSVTYQGDLPVYIRITDISEEGYFTPETVVSVNHPDADQYYLKEGDLVFARTGASVGKSYQYNPLDGKLVFAGFLIKIRPDANKLLPSYLAQYVKTNAYWNWVQVMSMRSGQPGINGNEYGQLLMPLPRIDEQKAIAEVLSDMDTEIAALETRRAKTQAIKQGMMQQLLTGKTRLV